MSKYVILALFAFLPMQAYCDRFWVSVSQKGVTDDILTIERDGGIVQDVQTTRINDYNVSYTIKYISGEDIRKRNEAWENIK